MSCEMRSMMTSYFLGSSMRMPPIFTNSALTPAFMPLILSTSAGGNVFSIPKRIAIFLFAIISVLNHARGATPVTPLKVLPRHPLPKRPIMLAVISVNVEPMRNPFATQNCRHLYVCVQAHIPVRRSQHDFHLPVAAQKPVIAHIRQVVRRIIEVDIVVVIAVEKALDVKRAAHGYARRNQIGMPHGKIQRMIAAKTASRHRDLRSPVLPLQVRHKLIDHIAFVLHVAPDPRSRMHTFVVPALAIHAVDAEDLDRSRLQFAS